MHIAEPEMLKVCHYEPMTPTPIVKTRNYYTYSYSTMTITLN